MADTSVRLCSGPDWGVCTHVAAAESSNSRRSGGEPDSAGASRTPIEWALLFNGLLEDMLSYRMGATPIRKKILYEELAHRLFCNSGPPNTQDR